MKCQYTNQSRYFCSLPPVYLTYLRSGGLRISLRQLSLMLKKLPKRTSRFTANVVLLAEERVQFCV